MPGSEEVSRAVAYRIETVARAAVVVRWIAADGLIRQPVNAVVVPGDGAAVLRCAGQIAGGPRCRCSSKPAWSARSGDSAGRS